MVAKASIGDVKSAVVGLYFNVHVKDSTSRYFLIEVGN